MTVSLALPTNGGVFCGPAPTFSSQLPAPYLGWQLRSNQGARRLIYSTDGHVARHLLIIPNEIDQIASDLTNFISVLLNPCEKGWIKNHYTVPANDTRERLHYKYHDSPYFSSYRSRKWEGLGLFNKCSIKVAGVTSGKRNSNKEVIMVDPLEAKRLAAEEMEKILARERLQRRRKIEAINGAWAMIGLTAGLLIEANTGKSIPDQLTGYWDAIVSVLVAGYWDAIVNIFVR